MQVYMQQSEADQIFSNLYYEYKQKNTKTLKCLWKKYENIFLNK